MAHSDVPWQYTADYVALTRRDIPLGGRTTYVVPHPVGPSPTDVTTFVYGQAEISIDNWPNVMYMLEPTDSWRIFKVSPKPPQKRDHNGQLMWEKWPRVGERPRPLLDYAVLPDNISTVEEWWWFHLWRRVDPRIHWKDITMRMEINQRTEEDDSKIHNRISNMSRRVWSKHCFMISWFNRRPVNRALIHQALQNVNIPLHLNTTRGLTPGLVDPDQPEGPRIPRPVLNGLGNPRGPNRNMRRSRPNAEHDPLSEDEEDDVDLVDQDLPDESKDEDEDYWSEDEDEEQESYYTQPPHCMAAGEASAGQRHNRFPDETLSEYRDENMSDNSDQSLARYSVSQDPDIQRLRGQINYIRQNPLRR